jgi:CubicO group peptidase (beta-lactamase class C family)
MLSGRNAMTAILIVATLLATHVAASGSEPDHSGFIAKYREHMQKVMKQNAIAGMSIAVVDRDSVVWCEGFGYYDNARRLPVTGSTPFFIGSICKTFTGISVMQLQEKGKFNLDEPLEKYVPGFRPQTRTGSTSDVTIRSVLTHHAGIPDFIKDKFSPDPPPFTGVLDIVNDDYLTFPPWTIFSYSNAGISLMGNLIETASGERYFAYLKNHLLEPMGMSGSGIMAPGNVPVSALLGYDSKGNEFHELFVFDAPAGCIYSSAEDMAKYIRMILGKGTLDGKRIIGSAALAEMMRVQNEGVYLDFGSPIGLIWSVYYNAAGKCIEHAGGSLAHRAELCIAPESGIGIIMMSNSSAGGKAMYAENYDMFGDLMGLRTGPRPTPPARSVRNIRHPEHNFAYRQGEVPKLTVRPDADLLRYAGMYGTFGQYFPFELREGRLLGKIYGQEVLLLPVETDEFAPSVRADTIAPDPKRRFYFDEVDGATILIQVDEWGNQTILGEKMHLTQPSGVWLERSGSYESDASYKDYQMFSNLRLAYEDSVLQLKIDFHIDQLGPPSFVAPLKVVSDSLAVVYGYSRFSGQSVQFKRSKSGREVMKFMGYTCAKRY